MDLLHTYAAVRFHVYVFGGCTTCFSYGIYGISFGLFYFFAGVFFHGILPLQSDWSLSCDHGLDYARSYESNNNNLAAGLGQSDLLGGK